MRGTLSRSIETKKSWIWFFRCSPKAGEVSSPEQPQKDRRDHSRLKLLQHRMGKLSPSRVAPFRSRFAQPRCLWTAPTTCSAFIFPRTISRLRLL